MLWDSPLKSKNDGDTGVDQELEHALVGWDWSADSIDDPAHQDHDYGAGESLVIPGGTWDIGGDLPLVDLPSQENDPGSSYLYKESIASSLRDIPDPRKERAKALKQARLKVVSEEDYDDPVQRKLVRLMRLRVQAILKGEEGAQEYLRWFFSPPSGGDLDFEPCSIFLGADPQAVRLKLQTYLYRHWIVLNDSMGFFVVPPPEEILSKGIYHAGSFAEFFVKRAWEWPGVTMGQLIREAIDRGIHEKTARATIEHLLESRLMLEQADNCYVVGWYGRHLERKNPWRS
jgi:hypothetical protein